MQSMSEDMDQDAGQTTDATCAMCDHAAHTDKTCETDGCECGKTEE